MNNQTIKIANRFREVILNGTLVANTNIKAQVQDLTWQEATQQVADLNTIALLTFHLNYYIEGVLQVLNGGTLDIRDKYSFDCPSITNEGEWNALRSSLFHNAEAFAAKIETLTDDILESDFVNPKYGTYRRNLECMIEHSYYHLGQVVLIRKMLPVS